VSASAAVIILCGLIIALAIYLFVRSMRKMSRGQCCEGCEGCSVKGNCSSADSDTDNAG
jgi:hypothetical protein